MKTYIIYDKTNIKNGFYKTAKTKAQALKEAKEYADFYGMKKNNMMVATQEEFEVVANQ